MKKSAIYFLIILLSAFTSYTIVANTQDSSSPLPLLQQLSEQMLDALKNNKAELKNNPQKVTELVQRILVPHFNLDAMAKAVVGRNYWLKATSSQRQAFIDEFTTLVMQNYSAALSAYSDQKVNFLPLRQPLPNSLAKVESVIIQSNGQHIAVSYLLSWQGNSWKVYDFSVEGVSVIESYRSQFAAELANTGFSGLLKRLQSHNRKNIKTS